MYTKDQVSHCWSHYCAWTRLLLQSREVVSSVPGKQEPQVRFCERPGNEGPGLGPPCPSRPVTGRVETGAESALMTSRRSITNWWISFMKSPPVTEVSKQCTDLLIWITEFFLSLSVWLPLTLSGLLFSARALVWNIQHYRPHSVAAPGAGVRARRAQPGTRRLCACAVAAYRLFRAQWPVLSLLCCVVFEFQSQVSVQHFGLSTLV